MRNAVKWDFDAKNLKPYDPPRYNRAETLLFLLKDIGTEGEKASNA
jgi:hypothetical protein